MKYCGAKSNLSQRSSRARRGYVLLEIVIAMGLFAAVSVSLVKALHVTSQTSILIQDDMRIQRVLRSALTDALSNPQLEESDQTVDLAEITGDDLPFLSGELQTLIEPLELENEEGQLLQNMFRIKVTLHWFADGEQKQASAETWRYADLYQP